MRGIGEIYLHNKNSKLVSRGHEIPQISKHTSGIILCFSIYYLIMRGSARQYGIIIGTRIIYKMMQSSADEHVCPMHHLPQSSTEVWPVPIVVVPSGQLLQSFQLIPSLYVPCGQGLQGKVVRKVPSDSCVVVPV